MSYDVTKFAKVSALKAQATRVKAELEKDRTRIKALEDVGAQVNVLEAVQVNGTALTIADKTVNITITEGTADGALLVNGVSVAFHGAADLFSKVATLIGEDTSKSVRTIANEELAKQLIPESAKESLDTLGEIAAWIQAHPDDAATMNSAITALQGIVAGIGGEGDDYATVVAYVQAQIEALSSCYTKTEASEINGNIKINGVETTVYTEPSDVLHGSAASDTEVAEMLNEVFGSDAEAGE